MKNKFMRIAAVTLMLCLVTTCAISGTFAKYTTSDYADDSARVAKWGITISAPADAFDDVYKDTIGDNGTTVSSTVKVVAPGTNGTLPTPIVNGQAEVAVKVTVVAEITLTGWEDADGNFYCPIVFKVGSTEIKQDGTNNTAALLEKAVEDAIKEYSEDVPANTAVTEIPAPTWSWAFNGDDDKDTDLGTAGTAEIGYKITVTVDQVN